MGGRATVDGAAVPVGRTPAGRGFPLSGVRLAGFRARWNGEGGRADLIRKGAGDSDQERSIAVRAERRPRWQRAAS